MAGLLAEYGYSITETFSKADVFLMNSCTVKVSYYSLGVISACDYRELISLLLSFTLQQNPSQDSFFSLVDKAKDTGKPVIVAGCVPQGQPSHSMFDVRCFGIFVVCLFVCFVAAVGV